MVSEKMQMIDDQMHSTITILIHIVKLIKVIYDLSLKKDTM